MSASICVYVCRCEGICIQISTHSKSWEVLPSEISAHFFHFSLSLFLSFFSDPLSLSFSILRSSLCFLSQDLYSASNRFSTNGRFEGACKMYSFGKISFFVYYFRKHFLVSFHIESNHQFLCFSFRDGADGYRNVFFYFPLQRLNR